MLLVEVQSNEVQGGQVRGQIAHLDEVRLRVGEDSTGALQAKAEFRVFDGVRSSKNGVEIDIKATSMAILLFDRAQIVLTCI